MNTALNVDSQPVKLSKADLIEILRGTFEVQEDDDGDIVVSTATNNHIYVNILKKLDLIRLSAFFSINQDIDKEKILEFTNKLNHKIVFSRFSCPELDSTTLLSEYFFSYKAGVSPHDVINALMLFEQVTWAALQQYDDANFIK